MHIVFLKKEGMLLPRQAVAKYILQYQLQTAVVPVVEVMVVVYQQDKVVPQ